MPPVAAQNQAALKLREAFAFHQKGDLAQAAQGYQAVLQIEPRHFDAMHMLGAIDLQNKRYIQAEQRIRAALKIKPDNAAAHSNLGNACYELKQLVQAKMSFEKAIALKPDFADAYYGLGNVQRDLNATVDALANFDKAIALVPHHDKALYNRGNTLLDLQRFQEAFDSYNLAYTLLPSALYLFGMRLCAKLHVCNWQDWSAEFQWLADSISRGERVSAPFPVLGILGNCAYEQKVAQIWIDDKHPASLSLSPITKHPRRERIRLGYFSADLQDHATTYLMAQLFEHHDKSQFELIAFSFGPSQQEDAMRQRVRAAFDQFIDVQALSAQAIAERAREMGIDIAIDLKGFTTDARTDIFAYRAAPIQVSYLGYPGTMGAPYMDYLLADSVLIPPQSQRYYTEKIAYLPHSYQVNDRQRIIADRRFTRTELGLPEQGFVFCCFNNNYKIIPSTFDGWMRILQQVPGSVLWLLEDNESASGNLRQEAQQRGIDPMRLIFAPRIAMTEHLARQRSADLFIDTLPYNAHTTASDALWAGLPVLTCAGETFASRVAASLLTAIEMPELITHSQEEFESLAVRLASDTQRLAELRQKLAANRLSTPLFDTALFTRHIETAYKMMMQRYEADLPADHLVVPR